MLALGTVLISSSAPGQTLAPATSEPIAPGLIKLTGEDEKRAKQLEEQIDKALKADRWDEAIARAEELLALRVRIQKPEHFEAVNARLFLESLRRIGALPKDDRAAYMSANRLDEQAEAQSGEGKFAEAKALYEKSLEIRRRVLGDNNPNTAESYAHLANCLNGLGQYAAAQSVYEKALDRGRRAFSDDHPATAMHYDNVAVNLMYQGKFAEAQPRLEKALEIRRRLLGEDHDETATGYNNLGSNLSAQSKYATAQPLLEKALRIARRLAGDDNPNLAIKYDNLAGNLDAQGMHAAAQPLLERALELSRRFLGADHPQTMVGYNNLAVNLGFQGKYAEAQPLYEKALEIVRRRHGERHPQTAIAYNNLAVNFRNQENYAAAQPLYEKALAISRRTLGEDHPGTMRTYNGLANNLGMLRRFAEAEPLLENALEIQRRTLSDDHADTATSFFNLAINSTHLGKYTAAQPLFEKALAIRLRCLGNDHPNTADSYYYLAMNLYGQGKYSEARERLLAAVMSQDAARLRVAFTGLGRAGATRSIRPALAAMLARLGQPADAWQSLEADLGRGLLDELAARQDRRLSPGDRARLRELTTQLESLDRFAESAPQGLDQAARATRFEELKRERDLVSIAQGEFQAKLVQQYGPLAGESAGLPAVQAALPADAALIAWVDIGPVGPNATDPGGDHWGVVLRAKGIPTWVRIPGEGAMGLWTDDDTNLAVQARSELRRRPDRRSSRLGSLVVKLRSRRLDPLADALGPASGLPPARTLIVLPSSAMAGIPIETLLDRDDKRTVSYVPSATVLKYLRKRTRPDRLAGLLALGDPVFQPQDTSNDPAGAPDHGLLLDVVSRDSNAASHGLKEGDVLLAYDGQALNTKDDLKIITAGNKPIAVEVWRDGRSSRRELAPGKLGVVFNARPPALALAERLNLQRVLQAARSGSGDFAPLPGTRTEAEAIVRLFQSADRATRALLGSDASEPELERIAESGDLARFGFIHLATHGLIDEAIPQRSAVILTQTGLPDPLEQALNHKPVFDGRLSVREIQRTWDLKAELVTLSACETALGREAGGEGFVGFTQALLMSGARSVCLSLWKVDDTATALLMQRFYANMLGRRNGLASPLPKAVALAEAKAWLRGLRREEVAILVANLTGGEARSKGAPNRKEPSPPLNAPSATGDEHPYDDPYFWAAFVLVGDPD
jgi:tetratricopeptide (TPR) repeat protein